MKTTNKSWIPKPLLILKAVGINTYLQRNEIIYENVSKKQTTALERMSKIRDT